MSWFTYYSNEVNPVEFFPPVRRKVTFPPVSENLKTGDWISVSLSEINIGRVLSLVDGAIVSSLDADSYVVVFEDVNGFTATESFVDNDSNLYFKSLFDLGISQVFSGSYYIYYHADNIQYIQKTGNQYIQTNLQTGSNFIAQESGTGPKVIDKYSTIVLPGAENERIATLSYISSAGTWVNSTSNVPGDKVFGKFDGPVLKIYGTKTNSGGKASIKIVKTSISNVGQSVVKEDVIDFYSANLIEDEVIYQIDLSDIVTIFEVEEIVEDENVDNQQSGYSETEEEDSILDRKAVLYTSYMFEIEILNEKNISSFGTDVSVTKYAFGKNYGLTINAEEIYENIAFISTGVIR